MLTSYVRVCWGLQDLSVTPGGHIHMPSRHVTLQITSFWIIGLNSKVSGGGGGGGGGGLPEFEGTENSNSKSNFPLLRRGGSCPKFHKWGSTTNSPKCFPTCFCPPPIRNMGQSFANIILRSLQAMMLVPKAAAHLGRSETMLSNSALTHGKLRSRKSLLKAY